MKILYISKYAVTPDLGQSTRQFFLSKYLTRGGHKTILVSSVSSGITTRPSRSRIGNLVETNGVEHLLIDGPLVNMGFSLKRILSWIIFEIRLLLSLKKINDKPDVVIVSSLSLLTFLTGAYLKRKYKAKLIVEVRDIWPLTLIEIGKFSKSNPIIKILGCIERFGYRNADGIVGSMPKLNEHVAQTIDKSFKFKCIPMGFDPEFFNQSESTYENAPKEVQDIVDALPKDKFIVGYAGTIGEANLVGEMLDAYKQIADQDIHFAILGDGPLKKALEDSSKSLQNFVFYPRINKKYVPVFLKACDLLINCWKNESLYRFGVSPNKWIDYMISGKPILTAYGGYKSIIDEANCGFFIEPNDVKLLANKILEISVMNKKELKEMGENGQRYAFQKHTYQNLAEEYVKFINTI